MAFNLMGAAASRGASFGTPGPQGGDINAPRNKTYRPDAGHNMTDAEYQAWKHRNSLSQNADKERQAMGFDQQRESFTHGLQEQSADNSFKREKEFATTQHNWNVQGATTAHARAVEMLQKQMGYKDQFMDKEFSLAQTDKNLDMGRQADAESRRLNQWKHYLDAAMGGSSSASATSGGGPIPETIDMDVSGMTAAEDAARNAAIARAKDTAGQNARAAMTALADVGAARGIGQGSGLMMESAAGITNDAAGQVGEVNRDQLMQQLQAVRQRASEQFQGAIQQRGQNIAARGQDMSMQASRMGMVPQLMGLITARY